MAKEPMGDVVVLLPGILGSALARDGKEIWAPSPGAIGRALWTLGGSVRSLTLEDDPWEQDDLGDGVTATRVMPDIHIIPGLWGIDGYTAISRLIGDRFDVVPGETYIEFPYDWRRDNRVAARRLRALADEKLHAQRQRNPDAKLVLVGHSMGGLVARYFLECLDGWRDTRMLDHVRDAAPRIAQRPRLPRQRVRQEGRSAQGGRPHRAAALADVRLPTAPGVSVRRPGRRVRTSRRDRRSAARRRPGAGDGARWRTSTGRSRPAPTATSRRPTRSTPSSGSPRGPSRRPDGTAPAWRSTRATAARTTGATGRCRGSPPRRSRPTTGSRRTSRCTPPTGTARCRTPTPCRCNCRAS